MVRYLATRIIEYYNIDRKDIGTFLLGQALEMEKKLEFPGLIYEAMLLECSHGGKDFDSVYFAKTLMRFKNVAAKDILCLAAMGSQNIQVYYRLFTYRMRT